MAKEQSDSGRSRTPHSTKCFYKHLMPPASFFTFKPKTNPKDLNIYKNRIEQHTTNPADLNACRKHNAPHDNTTPAGVGCLMPYIIFYKHAMPPASVWWHWLLIVILGKMDIHDSKTRPYNMSRIKGKNTKPEGCGQPQCRTKNKSRGFECL